MAKYFNEQKWRETLQHPDWYITLVPQLNELTKQARASDDATYQAVKELVYSFFERQLASHQIALGTSGPNWDAERQPINSIVIHQTSNKPGMSRERLSAIHLIRLYAAYYAHPSEAEKHITGQPIFSHHFWQGQQVFYAYHRLVRTDGTAERLLADNEIGWQAGNWQVNCRSIAICIDDDIDHSTPTASALDGIAKIIFEHYPHVAHSAIVGHCEINTATECPGDQFLGEHGWKRQLRERLNA
jgi:hypothetical protein